MKRLSIFFILLVIICFCLAYNSGCKSITNQMGKYICFCSSVNQFVLDNFDVVYSGVYYECSTNICNRENLKKNVSNIAGETYVLSKSNVHCEDIVSSIKFFSYFEDKIAQDRTVISGFAVGGFSSVVIGGKKVNTQICETGDAIYIGFPLLLGSF